MLSPFRRVRFMRQNWHEFGDFCLFADEWRCNVGVNTVTHPPQYSIATLPVAELRRVVDAMADESVRLGSVLKQNRGAWFAEFDRLRRKCEKAERAMAAS